MLTDTSSPTGTVPASVSATPGPTVTSLPGTVVSSVPPTQPVSSLYTDVPTASVSAPVQTVTAAFVWADVWQRGREELAG